MPGDVTLWPGLSGGEIIDLLGRLRGGVDSTRRAALIEQFDLDPTKKARTYSKGNRQKVALVAALASDVELLLLDEPTSGLDPLMEATFRTCVNELRERGRTVLLSSHILSEVEALCDRVSIIRAGRVVESGTISQLRHLTRTAVRAEVARPTEGLELAPRGARRARRGAPGQRQRRAERPAGPHRRAERGGGHVADVLASDAGGAVPAALRAASPMTGQLLGTARSSDWRSGGTGG